MKQGRKIDRNYQNPIDNYIIDFVEFMNPYFKKLKFTPNILTTLSLLFSVLGLWLYTKKYVITGILLFMIGYFFDCADGNFARTYNMETKFGDYYDHISDFSKLVLLIIVLFFYINISLKIKIIIFFIFSSLLIPHLIFFGCSEKIYNSNELMSYFSFLCKDVEKIHFYKYFGSATMTLLSCLMLFVLSYYN